MIYRFDTCNLGNNDNIFSNPFRHVFLFLVPNSYCIQYNSYSTLQKVIERNNFWFVFPERSYLIDANAQQRTYFKHLPFTAKIMEFTSKYLWKILPENQLSILYKRSDVVQSLVTSSQNVPQCTAAAGGGNKMGRKIHLTNIRSSSVSWEGGPPYDPILYEPHENSLFYVHRQQFRWVKVYIIHVARQFGNLGLEFVKSCQ